MQWATSARPRTTCAARGSQSGAGLLENQHSDAKLRVQTRAEILKLQQGLGTTTMYVTWWSSISATSSSSTSSERTGRSRQSCRSKTRWARATRSRSRFRARSSTSSMRRRKSASLPRAPGGGRPARRPRRPPRRLLR
ncbi:MAG: hypothetical protein E6G13_05465 [Actinobacteria bacterium]|nr:MAG: hypothetical protein E6G13_05465 [Actinomycetota bacterium]